MAHFRQADNFKQLRNTQKVWQRILVAVNTFAFAKCVHMHMAAYFHTLHRYWCELAISAFFISFVAFLFYGQNIYYNHAIKKNVWGG